MRNRLGGKHQQASFVPGELGVGEAIPDATDEAAGVRVPEMLPIVESRSRSLFVLQYCGSPLSGHSSSSGRTSGELRSTLALHQSKSFM